MVEFVTPFRDRTLELLDDRAELDAILAAGAEKAGRAVAERTLADVYDRVGFVRPRPLGAPVPLGSHRDDDDRGGHRRPGALGRAAAGATAAALGDDDRRGDPHPHHADAADRGRRGRGSRPSSSTWPRRRPSDTAFRIRLRGTGTFRPVSPVVFVMVAEGISGCEQLAVSVRRGPLAVDLQFPYHPHVTVAHHLADGSLDRAFDDAGRLRVRLHRRPVLALRARPRTAGRPPATSRWPATARWVGAPSWLP